MKEFSQIFKEIVSKISSDIKVEGQVSNEYVTCNTKWARKGKTLNGYDIDGVLVTKKITNVVDDLYIVLEDDVIVSDVLTLNSPFDITGTKKATNLEWTKKDNFAMEKTPLVWLLDSFEERTYSKESALERSVDCKIFFLDETDIKNYYTDDHKQQVIQPMIKLQEEFLKEIKKNRNFKTIDDVSIRYFSRFGTETAQGFEKNILDANLSGLVLSVTLKKFKENCKC